MTDPEPTPPARDQRIIDAAIERATDHYARGIVAAIKDRGGNQNDVAILLGRINAVIVATITDGRPEARAKSEALIALIGEHSLTTTRKLRAQYLLRPMTNVKGLRP